MHRATIIVGVATAVVATSLLTPAAASAADPTWTVNVRVLSPSGQPAPGVFVADYVVGSGTTDAQGRVTFETPAPPQGVCASLDESSQHLAGPTGWAPACKGIPASDGNTSNVTLRFTVGAAVTGRVTDARTGKPVARIDVADIGMDVWARTVSDGTWTLRNLPTSDLTLYTGSTQAFPGAPYGYAGNDGVDVHVDAGTTTDAGTWPLRPFVQYTGTLSGLDGKPLRNVEVTVGDVDGDPATPFPPAPTTPHVTDTAGHYAVTYPWTASPHRMVCADGRAPTAKYPAGLGLRCLTADSRQLTVTTNLTLSAGGAVHGTVTGATTYTASVVITVQGENVVVSGTVARDGTYTIRGVPTGRRVVTVTSGDRQGRSGFVAVQAGVTTEVPVIALGS